MTRCRTPPDFRTYFSLGVRLRQLPTHLERLVRLKNTKFLHERNQYSVEYFAFVKSLCQCVGVSLKDEKTPVTSIGIVSLIGMGSELMTTLGEVGAGTPLHGVGHQVPIQDGSPCQEESEVRRRTSRFLPSFNHYLFCSEAVVRSGSTRCLS